MFVWEIMGIKFILIFIKQIIPMYIAIKEKNYNE